HERGRPLPRPALVDVRAARLLADRDEREPAHHAADLLVLAGRVRADLQPLRPLEAQGSGGRGRRKRREAGVRVRTQGAAIISRAKTSAKRLARTGATSVRAGARPRTRSMLVTPPSAIPHGTMPRKLARGSSDTFRAKPCVVTHRAMWTPIAAILS